jgi:hypothetical protein
MTDGRRNEEGRVNKSKLELGTKAIIGTKQ